MKIFLQEEEKQQGYTNKINSSKIRKIAKIYKAENIFSKRTEIAKIYKDEIISSKRRDKFYQKAIISPKTFH